jgi:hypothetical protein
MKTLIKRYINHLLYTLLFICLASCSQKERPNPKQVESLKVLMAKNIETVNATALSSGYTRYMLAFSDGWTERTSFGYYTCLKIGDTIRFVKDENESDYWYEMKPNCN